jgi:hypothetical protein
MKKVIVPGRKEQDSTDGGISGAAYFIDEPGTGK